MKMVTPLEIFRAWTNRPRAFPIVQASAARRSVCLLFWWMGLGMLMVVVSCFSSTNVRAESKSDLVPTELNFEPGPEYSDDVRMFQGIPSIEVARNGRLWATWYGGGTGEGPENYVMLSTSFDGGAGWSELKLVIDPPHRASEPALWHDPQGRLWLMWNEYFRAHKQRSHPLLALPEVGPGG
ncbi:MAG: exo-alpha-sialidase [Planctomycetaceae bacterium]|nr:MAG: exo-alpha-sialidase [Planctomycetaceae bacterium]